ncbi:MAG: AmmeMemoRadiSam system protein B, partial [Dehalococcoidaceae bacterium]|nr:AmmeMemoRadiSam system protein B [Dehalococcoidaceae bacterium]
MMLRKPAVAGRFYPESREELGKLIKSLVDMKAPREDVLGAVLPHAGYVYSGAVAGAAVSRMKLKDTAVIIGPNHTGMGRPFAIMTEGAWQTPLGDVQIDTPLARHLLNLSRYLEEDAGAHQFEHSIEVELPLLQYFKPDIRIVPIVVAGAGATVYREIGQAIAKAIHASDTGAVIIASSDLTHYEPQETARDKDSAVIAAILEMDEDRMLEVVRGQRVSMCGYGPVACLVRAAREMGGNQAELIKYQTSAEASGDYASVVGYAGIIIKARQLPSLVSLARRAVETYVRERKIIKPPAELSPEMKPKAGVFVSLHKGHELRGCIGTFSPARSNVAEEVITNAIHSATEDPRFSPVSAHELADLDYSVDVLSQPEPVQDISELDPVKYGVIVEAGLRRGLLLPDL